MTTALVVQRIAEDVTLLVDPLHHAEVIGLHATTRDRVLHRTTHPSLLDQLRDAGNTANSREGGRGGYESRPAARLESTDTLTAIATGTAWWLGWGTRNASMRLESDLRALVGLAALMHDDAAKAHRDHSRRDPEAGCVRCLAADTTGWVVRARVVVGWDTPPYSPPAPCPVCEDTGTLRVRLADRLGVCVGCGATWDPSTIGLLADHVRRHTGSDTPATAGSLPTGP